MRIEKFWVDPARSDRPEQRRMVTVSTSRVVIEPGQLAQPFSVNVGA
jgi:hypothetical protein